MAIVSMIIPVYNVQKYLDCCIESIVKQSYTDFECILVDDGSTDGSGLICDTWKKKDSRIRVIHQANGGVSTARNNGILSAHGQYITFVDSDDWVDGNYLQLMVDEIEKHNCELVVCGLTKHFDDGIQEQIVPDKLRTLAISGDYINEFVKLNEKNLLYGPCTKLYKKSILKEHEILFDRSCSYGEDLLFNYLYLKYVDRLVSIPSAMYHYRIFGKDSLSSKFRTDQFDLDYKQWLVLSDFYRSRKLWNDVSKNYLYRRLWGIIYDGIFMVRKIQEHPYHYLKRICAVPEIEELWKFKYAFTCNRWIKALILRRQALIFYLILKLKE